MDDVINCLLALGTIVGAGVGVGVSTGKVGLGIAASCVTFALLLPREFSL